MIFKCPGSLTFKQPKPDDLLCTFCGAEVEIWSDEVESCCVKCGRKLARPQPPTCFEWCQYAKECVGQELYDKFLNNKAATQGIKTEKGEKQ